jgi:hypothetical protein
MTAATQGLSMTSYLSSMADSFAEWYIPVKSFEPITIPKKMMRTIFSMVDRIKLEPITKEWATESKNIVLLSGEEFNLKSAIAFSRRIARYFMGADTKIVNSSDGKRVTVVVRHDAGENFSFFAVLVLDIFSKHWE